MKKITFLLLVLTALITVCACAGTGIDTTDTVADTTPQDSFGQTITSTDLDIGSIEDYNLESELDSHDGKTQYSHLEMSYRDKVFLDNSVTTTSEAWYPRIKKTANGEYILLYMNGQVGHDIYITHSKNLKKWNGTEKLFTNSKSPKRMYASADAIVLANGDIIAAAGFRGDYTGDQYTNGIEIRRSTDNGKTWSAPEIIYRGGVWEPSLLQLPSGEVQIYWTNTHVKGAPSSQLGRADDNSTGTAMLRSFDNGKTWNSNPSVIYDAQIVAQQYTVMGTDGKYYSGQMPVATVLNNGKIALALEVRTKNSKGEKTYNMSFAYTDASNSWPVSLGLDEEGPVSLIKDMYLKAAGPYIRQFKSGETLLTYHWDSWYSLIGNTSATKFNDRVKVFGDEKVDIWGSTEIIGTHTALGTVPMANAGGIFLSKLHLNHTIKAVNAEIAVDGVKNDFKDADQAFFVGSDSQAQAAIRVAQDSDFVYFIAEVLDNKISNKDRVVFCIGNTETDKYMNVSVNPLGEIGVNIKSSISVNKDQLTAAALFDGTVNDFADKDNGYVVELKVPKSLIGDVSTISFCPMLNNQDASDGVVIQDSIGALTVNDRSNWLRIELD